MFSYQKSFVNPTLPVDEAQFWALVRATKWNEAIDQYRETGEAALKRKLPAFIFQAVDVLRISSQNFSRLHLTA